MNVSAMLKEPIPFLKGTKTQKMNHNNCGYKDKNNSLGFMHSLTVPRVIKGILGVLHTGPGPQYLHSCSISTS